VKGIAKRRDDDNRPHIKIFRSTEKRPPKLPPKPSLYQRCNEFFDQIPDAMPYQSDDLSDLFAGYVPIEPIPPTKPSAGPVAAPRPSRGGASPSRASTASLSSAHGPPPLTP